MPLLIAGETQARSFAKIPENTYFGARLSSKTECFSTRLLRQNANLASSRFLHIFEQYAPAILGQRVQGLGPPNIFRSKGLGFRVNYGRKLEVFNLATVFCSRNACFSAKT